MGKNLFVLRPKILLLGLLFSLTPREATALEVVSATLSKDAYNLGEKVQVRLTLRNELSSALDGLSGTAILRVAGGAEVSRTRFLNSLSIAAGVNYESGYREVWAVPQNAFLGLYELELNLSSAASSARTTRHFVAYRQDLAVELLETERKQYVVGDVIRVRAVIKNLAQRPLQNLKLVLGRGYPWISGFGRGTAISGAPPEQVYSYSHPIN